MHEGMPTFGAAAPVAFYAIPEEDRERRVSLGSDDCIIDGEQFFVRGCIGPFFGWLNAWLKPYPDTINLKTMVHLRSGMASTKSA